MIINKVRQELARHDKPANKINYQQFFKEKLPEPYGLRSAIIKKISDECFREIKDFPKADTLDCCDRMIASRERYMRGIAFEWALKIKKQYTKTDFRRFETWLKKYVDNWGACDSLCCGAIGHLVLQFPDLAQKTKKWAQSLNRWQRRAAAVSLIVPVRNRLLLDEIFAMADTLLTDADDMVQKGYGWMLKEASNKFPDKIFKYVMNNKAAMPRTALRYAIEKLPAPMRKEAMKK